MAYPGFSAENALVPSKTKYRGKNLYGGGGVSVSPQSDDIGDEDIEDEDMEDEDIEDEEE